MTKQNANDALWNLYSAEKQGLYSYAISITGSPEQAEDAVHSAVLSVATGNGHVRQPKAYLYRAVRNKAFSIRRDERRVVSNAAPPSESSNVEQPDAQSLRREDLERLHAALLKLDELEQHTITLHITGRLKFREIASVLVESMWTSASRYRRALKKLRKILENDSYEQ